MTYQQLLDSLSEFSKEELQKEVVVFNECLGLENYHPVQYVGKCEGDDEVPPEHPIIIIDSFKFYISPE